MSVLQWVPVKSSLTCNNYVFVNIFSLPFSEQWNEAYSAPCYAVINQRPNYPQSQCLRWQVLGSSRMSCVSRVYTLANPTVQRNIRYLFKRRVHFVSHTIQSHSAGLSLRVRGVYVAWRGGGLARPSDPDHGAAAAAATNGCQPRARARSGGGEGWKERWKLLLDEADVRMIFYTILPVLLPCSYLRSVIRYDS